MEEIKLVLEVIKDIEVIINYGPVKYVTLKNDGNKLFIGNHIIYESNNIHHIGNFVFKEIFEVGKNVACFTNCCKVLYCDYISRMTSYHLYSNRHLIINGYGEIKIEIGSTCSLISYFRNGKLIEL